MRIKSICSLFAGLLAFAACAETGESWKSAASLKAGSTVTVTLVNEKDLDWESGDDPEDKYYGSGCYYFRISCKNGTPYTVYTSGFSGDSDILVDVSDLGTYNDKDDDSYYSGFADLGWDYDYLGADYYYAIGQTDNEWDPEDPGTCTYIVYVCGSIGDRVTISFASGIVPPPVTYGTPDHPQSLSISDKEGSTGSKSLINGSYYCKSTLNAGCKYKFWTTGGSDENNLTLTIYTEDGSGGTNEWRRMDGIGTYDEGWIVLPPETKSYLIVVDGTDTFNLHYAKVSGRKPSAHKNTPKVKEILGIKDDLVAFTPDAEGIETDCVAGYRNYPNSGYFDSVIDEQLFKVSLAKNAYYVFETAGAETNLVMELYDKDGKVLVSNSCGNTNGLDCLVAYQAPSAGDYWLGVCQWIEDEENTNTPPAYTTCRVIGRKVAKGDGATDAWDPMDDLPSTVEEGLMPAIGKPEDDPAEKGSLHGTHWLGITDWVDTYRIGARKNIEYQLKTVSSNAVQKALWKLSASVYALDSKGNRKSVAEIPDLDEGGSFIPTEDGVYYIDVRVAGGQGVTYGPYDFYSLASNPWARDEALGTLRVDIGGATAAEGAGWSLKSDGKSAAKYKPGDSIILKEGAYSVTFVDVKDWTKPAEAPAGVVSNEITVISAKYSDTHDDPTDDANKGDGSKNGKKLTELKPSATKVQQVSRSLWSNDREDWYKFKTAVNSYYTFALQPSSKLGDAYIEVLDENGEYVIAEGTEAKFLFRGTKASTYYLRVRHATELNEDSQYVMTYSTVQVGGIGFAKTSYSVKDSATSIAIPVERKNGKAEALRVRYTTKGGTAEQWKHYEPQTGILSWANGDSKAKTITVRLIPDLVAAWDENRTFEVELAALPPAELDIGEYVPSITSPKTTVTITEATKKAAGTVQFAGAGDSNEPLANLKKPAASVAAGEDLVLWLERTGGSDGRIGVTLTPTKGKALPDTDYVGDSATLTWEDGEDEPKKFVLKTLRASDAYQAAKTMTVKIAADKTIGAPAKLGAAATVTITDPQVTRTMESYSSSFAKADGITVKAAANTWYFDEAGLLRSVMPAAGKKCEITVTLSGPGKFAFTPNFEKDEDDKSTFTCTIGKEKISVTNGMPQVVRYLGKGSTKVTFTLNRDKASKTDVCASFDDAGNGDPFLWKLLPLPKLVSPLAGEVPVGDCTEKIRLMWTDAEDEEIRYSFHLATDKKNLGKNDFISADQWEYPDYDLKVKCDDCGLEGGGTGTEIEAGKTYYWRVDSEFVEGEKVMLANVNSAVWTLQAVACGAPYPVVASGTDAYGREISGLTEREGTAIPVTLLRGTAVRIALAAEKEDKEGEKIPVPGVSYTLSGKLPTGLKFASNGVISGIPTKAETVTSVIRVKTTSGGGTIAFKFTVESLKLAAGTFGGLVETDDGEIAKDEGGNVLDTAVMKLGSFSLTAKDDGKLSASVAVGGTTYKFSANSYSAVVPALTNGQPGVTACISNAVQFTINKKKTDKYYNVLTVTACRGETDDWEALDTPMEVTLTLHRLTADKQGVTSSTWTGVAYRDNAKLSAVLAAEKPFTGYYTVSLSTDGSAAYQDGYGYLTLTLDAKGKVKIAGLLSDNSTKPSASAVPGYISEGTDGKPEMRVPVYFCKGKVAFGGWLRLRLMEDDVPVVSADSRLLWTCTDKTKTYGGKTGFFMDITPVGGYYNTVYNLQAYYLDYAFRVDAITAVDLPEEVLGSRTLLSAPGLYGDYLKIDGNNVTMAKQSKKMRTDNKKLIDWTNTVNPANITFSYKRATGITSGQFELWGGNAEAGSETEQKKLGSYKHYGVMLFSRDPEASVLPFDEAVIPGFCVIPVTIEKRKWSAALPFVILPEARDLDWTEEDWGW